MKKILIIALCLISIVAIVGGIIIFTRPTTSSTEKISNTKIMFSYSSQTFLSNKKYDNSFNNYNLTIINTAGVAFENPNILTSTNISKTIQNNNSQIEITFYITSGSTFSFTLQTDNFEDITDTKTATEYVQKENIQLQITTTQDGEYTNYNNNSIYLIDNEYKTQALQDGYYCEYFIKAIYQANPLANFNIRVAETGCLYFDNITKKLTATTKGSSYVIVEAQDGSGAKKQFLFDAKEIQANDVDLSTTPITLDVNDNPTITLTPTPIPAYAKNYSITFSTSDNTVFTFNNYTLTAVAKGSANLFVNLNGQQVKTIVVNVTATADPTLTISLQDTTQNTLGDNVEFVNNVCTLHTLSLSGVQQLTFNVAFENWGVSPTLSDNIISDDNNLQISSQGEDGWGTGTTNSKPYTIFVDTTKTGSIIITFTANAQGAIINKELTITLINT